MHRIDRRKFTVSLTGGLVTASVWARSPGQIAAPSNVDVNELVHAVAATVRREYVDPEIAEIIANKLLRDLARGSYASSVSRRGLADRLTEDLRAQTNDLHMSVTYAPRGPDEDAPNKISEDDLDSGAIAWGVQTVARLPGNIGLLRVTHFESGLERFACRCGAAMELLGDTAALIVDLTLNHGGDADSAAYLTSYFFDGEIELGRVRFRRGPEKIVKTYKTVTGPRYGKSRPIFVAISNKTFSAGEAFAWQLKSRRAATLIGRRTRGGAHIGEFFDLPDDFKIFVVTARDASRHWEGVGVAPDIPADEEFAVGTAHRLALQKLIDGAANERLRQVLCNVRDHAIENLSSFAL